MPASPLGVSFGENLTSSEQCLPGVDRQKRNPREGYADFKIQP